MRAIVLASRWAGGLFEGHRTLAPQLLLGDRPLVERLVGEMFRAGVTQIEWVHGAGADASAVGRFLNCGSRWGMVFRHHTIGGTACEHELVGRLAVDRSRDDRVLIGDANRLVDLGTLPASPTTEVVLFESGSRAGWTGWALLAGAPSHWPHVRSRQQLESWLMLHPGASRVRVPDLPDVATISGYLDANRAALQATALAANVVVAPGARVHPSATVVGPVFIGSGCEIGAGATVGPFVSVGPGSIIDRRVRVTESVIQAGTYVGEAVCFDYAVADQDQVLLPNSSGAVNAAAVTLGSLNVRLLPRPREILGHGVQRVARYAVYLREFGRRLRRSVSEGVWLAGSEDAPVGPVPPAPVSE